MNYKYFHIVFYLLVFQTPVWAQNAKFDLDKGNSAFEAKEYKEAEANFRKAMENGEYKEEARFNLGNTMLRNEKLEEAIAEYKRIANDSPDKLLRSDAFHNMGNAYMMSNKLDEAIESYKNALRIDPKDDDTRYNLAVAQNLKNQKQQQKQENKDENKDDKNQDKKDGEKDENKKDENKDGDKDQDKKDEKDKEDEQDKKDGDKDKDKKDEEKKEQEAQAQPVKISKEDAERLLQMMEDEERDVQDKLNKKKAKKKSSTIEKDW